MYSELLKVSKIISTFSKTLCYLTNMHHKFSHSYLIHKLAILNCFLYNHYILFTFYDSIN